MAARQVSVGVECSGAGLRLALMTSKPVPTILHCEEIPVQPGDEAHIGAVVAKVLEKFGAKKADVHLVFSPPQPAPGRHYLFTAPKLTKSELLAVATRELKRDGTVDPGNAYFAVDSVEDAEMEGGAKGQRYLLVALAKEPVDVAAMSLLESKIVLRSATTSAMGILQTVPITDLPSTGIVALAQLDIRRSTLMVLENGTPRFFRDIPTSFAKGGREGSDDALIAQALARELDISLVFFAQQFRPKQVDTIMIVGDADVADRVTEWIEENQTYKVVRFQPNAKLKVEPNVPANILPFAPAIGAALGSVRGKFSPDLLPSDLKGRPERLIATVIGGVTLVFLMAIVMHLRSRAVEVSDDYQAKLTAERSELAAMKHQIDIDVALDTQAVRGDVWRTYFEALDLKQKKFLRLLFNLQNIAPPKVSLVEVALSSTGSGGKPAAAGARSIDMRVGINGVAFANDLQGAQTDVLAVYRATENMCPEVVASTLTPINPKPPINGHIEQPFSIGIDVSFARAPPGVKK